MEEVNKHSQEESNFKSAVDELTFTMAKLAKCGVGLSIKEEMTPMATSYTKSKFEIHQPPMEKRMSIQELVAKHMNEGKNMVEMSFEGQHESLSSLLEVIEEEEDSSYNEVFTSRSKEELEKIIRRDDDVQDLKALVVMEDEPTSSESHDTIKEKVLKAIPEMAP